MFLQVLSTRVSHGSQILCLVTLAYEPESPIASFVVVVEGKHGSLSGLLKGMQIWLRGPSFFTCRSAHVSPLYRSKLVEETCNAVDEYNIPLVQAC
jgi:hypothetical protein